MTYIHVYTYIYIYIYNSTWLYLLYEHTPFINHYKNAWLCWGRCVYLILTGGARVHEKKDQSLQFPNRVTCHFTYKQTRADQRLLPTLPPILLWHYCLYWGLLPLELRDESAAFHNWLAACTKSNCILLWNSIHERQIGRAPGMLFKTSGSIESSTISSLHYKFNGTGLKWTEVDCKWIHWKNLNLVSSRVFHPIFMCLCSNSPDFPHINTYVHVPEHVHIPHHNIQFFYTTAIALKMFT